MTNDYIWSENMQQLKFFIRIFIGPKQITTNHL